MRIWVELHIVTPENLCYNFPMKKFRIVNNAPAVLGFTTMCMVALLLHYATNSYSDRLIFSVYRSSLKNPLTYLRFFTHVFGHADMAHFFGNMMTFVLIGPMLEEKYGTKDLSIIMAVTAFVTGLVHFIFFPSTGLLGASGIVFAFILLASFTEFTAGTIPVTFLLVAVIYIGNQVFQGLTVQDNISNLTHIIGGIIGAVFGFILNRKGGRR